MAVAIKVALPVGVGVFVVVGVDVGEKVTLAVGVGDFVGVAVDGTRVAVGLGDAERLGVTVGLGVVPSASEPKQITNSWASMVSSK